MTDLNSADSFPLSNDRSIEASKVRLNKVRLSKLRLNADTKGRLVGLLGLAALSAWISVSLSSNLYLSVLSQHWPRATARIISSGVYTSGSSGESSWAPGVDYEYEVGGASHRSSNIRYLMRTFYDVESAAEVQAAYPVGRQVSVAYDPRNPNRSVLEPGVPPGMWSQAVIPLFLCGLCGYILFEIAYPRRRILLQSYALGGDCEE